MAAPKEYPRTHVNMQNETWFWMKCAVLGFAWLCGQLERALMVAQ